MHYKYTKSRQDTQLKGKESSDFMGIFADNHYNRQNFSQKMFDFIRNTGKSKNAISQPIDNQSR